MAPKTSTKPNLKQLYSDINRLQKQKNILNEKIEKKMTIIRNSLPKKNRWRNSYNSSQDPYEMDRLMGRMSEMDRINNKHGRTIHKHRTIVKRLDVALKDKKLKIREPRISNLKKSARNGYFIRNKIFPTLHVTAVSIPAMIKMIKRKYQNAIELLSNKRKKYHLKIGDNTVKNIRLVFCDEYGSNISSTNVRSIDDVGNALRAELHKHNATGETETGKTADPYDRYLMATDFFIFNSRNKTGCAKKCKYAMVFPLDTNELIKLYCPKAKNNHCFDMCLIKARQFSKLKILNYRAFLVRRKLKIDNTIEIDPNSTEAHRIADEIGVGYKVFHGIRNPNRMSGDSIENSFKVYCEYGKQDENTAWILKIASHCYLIKDRNIYKKQCEKCGAKRARGLALDHKCNSVEMSYFQNQICKNPILSATTLKKDNKKRYVFFDLETLPCGLGDTHLVYAVGWYDVVDDKYRATYGKNAMSEFMKWAFEQKDKTFIAYNGCRFDFYFLQKAIIKNKMKPKFLMNNGRILSLKWGGEQVESKRTGKTITIGQNCVWDLCNFMPGFSLKKACKSFGTTFQKLDFDHELMLDWDCVEQYKNDVLHYLKYDVMSLKELTEKYVETAENLYDASPTKYLTLSSYAEKVWANSIEDEIIEIPDMDKQKFIRLSIYGGRTYPSRKRFQSKYYKTIKSNKSNARKLKQLYKLLLQSGDYIFNGDINSQYPACMAGCELMPTLFPTGNSEWINNPIECKNIFDTGKQLGIFEIEFTCPKNLLHPILPRKKIYVQKSGKSVITGVEWSLTDGKGVYNTADIQNAINNGYQIKFTGKGLVWENTSDNIFMSYISLVYAHKVEASVEKNKVKRQIAKLMMNSLYGKTLQNPVSKSECIARSVDDVEKFLFNHILTDWVVVYDNDETVDYVLLTGEKTDDEKIAKKPAQLGSFVLAYSRRLWLLFVKTINPSLTEQVTTYQDTDSLHIMGCNYDKLVNAGLIDDSKLGFLSNDCDDNGLIVNEINLAPKCYMYECLTENGELVTVMKSKGIMKNKLKEEWYENHEYLQLLDDDDPIKPIASWTGMKKINKRISKSEKENGVEHFTIKKQSYSRTFYKNVWTNMNFKDNHFYPFGYEST